MKNTGPAADPKEEAGAHHKCGTTQIVAPAQHANFLDPFHACMLTATFVMQQREVPA